MQGHGAAPCQAGHTKTYPENTRPRILTSSADDSKLFRELSLRWSQRPSLTLKVSPPATPHAGKTAHGQHYGSIDFRVVTLFLKIPPAPRKKASPKAGLDGP